MPNGSAGASPSQPKFSKLTASTTATMYFDTHAHLDQSEFDDDRAEVVARAVEAGVSQIVCIGTTAETSAKCVDIAAQYEAVYAAVGIQPNSAAEAHEGDWQRIVELSTADKVVAIGETGLDRYWDYTPFELQQDYFDRHIQLAHDRQFPFIVHLRECDADILASLRAAHARLGSLSGVMHSFTGSAETAAECLSLGLYVSFAGMVTFKKAQELRDIAQSIPDDRILIETDSPYLSPVPFRGKRNEPARVVHTCACLAEVRGVDAATFARQTTANARRLFNL